MKWCSLISIWTLFKMIIGSILIITNVFRFYWRGYLSNEVTQNIINHALLICRGAQFISINEQLFRYEQDKIIIISRKIIFCLFYLSKRAHFENGVDNNEQSIDILFHCEEGQFLYLHLYVHTRHNRWKPCKLLWVFSRFFAFFEANSWPISFKIKCVKSRTLSPFPCQFRDFYT